MKTANFKVISLSAIFINLILATAAFAQEATENGTTTPAADDGGVSLWGYIVQGGWAMWPLGICMLLMFYLAIQGWTATNRKKFVPDAIIDEASGHLRRRQLDDARNLIRSHNTVMSRALHNALAKARVDENDAGKEKIEASLLENLDTEENSINQGINYLNVIATVSPMIGLLGTVSGMIGAFQTIGRGGMGRPELLAGDIGSALITTAAGLIIGIPAMVAYFVMKSRLSKMMSAATHTASLLIDHLAGEITTEN